MQNRSKNLFIFNVNKQNSLSRSNNRIILSASEHQESKLILLLLFLVLFINLCNRFKTIFSYIIRKKLCFIIKNEYFRCIFAKESSSYSFNSFDLLFLEYQLATQINFCQFTRRIKYICFFEMLRWIHSKRANICFIAIDVQINAFHNLSSFATEHTEFTTKHSSYFIVSFQPLYWQFCQCTS